MIWFDLDFVEQDIAFSISGKQGSSLAFVKKYVNKYARHLYGNIPREINIDCKYGIYIKRK